MATIRDWWRRWPGANVGIATGARSGIVALDVDPRAGGDDSLAELVNRYGPLPETIEALTGGGGQHFLFRHPGGLVKCRTGFMPGLDVKADGGYIVGEPSMHASGRRYAWELSHLPDQCDLAECPAFLRDQVESSERASPPVHAAAGGSIPEGKRNATLASLAGAMRRKGMGPDEIRPALHVTNSKRCHPPLPESEVDSIAQSVGKYAPAPRAATADLLKLTDVVPVPVSWLWPGRIPLGKLTVFAGNPGLGKSFLTLDIAARVSRGAPWPDRTDEVREPGGVVLMSAEDDPADTILPRLNAAGADVSRITILRGVFRGDGKSTPTTLEHIDVLADALERTPNAKLLVIDPISAYHPKGSDSHNNTDVRGMLVPLVELAARMGVAVLVVTHLNKSGQSKSITRFMGSLALPAAARAAWAVVEDQADRSRRKLLPVKNNLAHDTHGLGFRIGGDPPRVEWEERTVAEHADDALAEELVDAEGRSARGEAKEWLRDALACGPVPAIDLQERAEREGVFWGTLRRAATELGVTSRREGFGEGSKWVWALPTSEGAQAPTKMLNVSE
jgi:hypothetical protein